MVVSYRFEKQPGRSNCFNRIIKHEKPAYWSITCKSKVRAYLNEIRIIRAVNLNNIEEINNLLIEGVDANTKDSCQRSLLHLAVSKEYTNIVKLLLLHGANPNIKDLIQNTPLHLAAILHNLPIITLLINAGADVEVESLHGKKPLDLARSKLQILLQSSYTKSIEMLKLKEEVEQVIDLLLSILNHKRKETVNNGEEMMAEVEKFHVAELECMKLAINTVENNDHLDDQMAKLLAGIECIQI